MTAPAARLVSRSQSTRFLVLLTVVTALTAELIRFSGPLLDSALERNGVIVAALTALGTYLAPGVLAYALSARRRVSGHMVLIAVIGLVGARIACQFLDGMVRFGVGLATVALSVATLGLVAAAASRTHGGVLGAGVGYGLFLSASINLSLGTWDPLWRSGPLPIIIALALGATAIWAAWAVKDAPPAPHTLGLWAVGPVLSLGVVMFGNPAFISSQSHTPLWLSALVLFGIAVALPTVLARSISLVRVHAIISVLGVATIFFIAPWPAPPSFLVSTAILIFVALAALSTLALLTVAVSRQATVTSSARLSLAISGSGALIILPILLFQLDYDIPLGFPNALVFVAASAILGIGALSSARKIGAQGPMPSAPTAQGNGEAATSLAPVVTLVGVLLVVGAFQTSPLTARESSTVPEKDFAQVFNWNLHYGTSTKPSVDLDDMVALIASEQATVVTLQEVSRGWVMGGGADMVNYLAHQLGMEYAFVGAADLQFGNALLWHPDTPITDIERIRLTYGDGPQWRSAIGGTVNLAQGQFRVITAHLQHRKENTPTRIAQLDDLFADMPAGGSTLITGDFNAEPGWTEIDYLFDHGFISGQDEAGDPEQLTWPTNGPEMRIDWMFGKDLGFTNYKVLSSQTSDHFPMSATIELN